MEEEQLPITKILQKYHLLDEEEYLVPPESQHALNLVKRLAKLRDIVENGGELTTDQDLDLHDIQIAYDYYNDALDEEVLRMTGEYVDDDEEECDEDEYEEDNEDDEDEDEAVSLEDKGIPVSKLGEQLIDDDEEEDDTYEP